jgi:trans-2,3-dihydro-3-hydroxyanthranilate isomerase
MNYSLLNVFTRGAYSGNQLAVVEVTAPLTAERMQSIARDFNFSETVFITDHRNLRIFTPKSELPFAGHPTIGAGWWISQQTQQTQFTLSLALGLVPIRIEQGKVFLTFPGSPKISPYSGDLTALLSATNVLEDQVQKTNICQANVGPEFLVIPLNSHAALKAARPPMGFPEPVKCYFIYQEHATIFHVRMFAPSLSVMEDAATGSAACALAGYCRDVRGIPSGNVTVYQGAEMGRPSEIQVSWDQLIHVGGSVEQWAHGKLTTAGPLKDIHD